MKQVILFEDYEKSLLSKFLYKKYKSDEIFMAGGGGKVVNVADRLRQIYDIVIVYLDVVPDNQNTIYFLDELLFNKSYYHWDNVFVVPIPCIEYFVITSFWNSLIPEGNLIKVKGNYRDTTYYLNNKDTLTSFERFCKHIGKVTEEKCHHIVSVNEYEKTDRGRFYCVDCNCNKQYVSDNHSDFKMRDKIDTLMNLLPLRPCTYTPEQDVILKQHAQLVSDGAIMDLIRWYNRYLELGYAYDIQQ